MKSFSSFRWKKTKSEDINFFMLKTIANSLYLLSGVERPVTLGDFGVKRFPGEKEKTNVRTINYNLKLIFVL